MKRNEGSGPDVAQLPLYDKKGNVVAHALVDADRLEWASQWTWRLGTEGYPCRSYRLPDGTLETRLLHREVLGLPVHGSPRARFVDQTNRLNVTRRNLRLSDGWVVQAVRHDPKLADRVLNSVPGRGHHRIKARLARSAAA